MSQKKTPQYKITMYMNGETVEDSSNSVSKSIMNLKPEFLHTEMYVTIESKDRIYERKLNLIQGRKIFADKVSMELFVNNLI